jgi:uncharacterized protein (DUF486 family)
MKNKEAIKAAFDKCLSLPKNRTNCIYEQIQQLGKLEEDIKTLALTYLINCYYFDNKK